MMGTNKSVEVYCVKPTDHGIIKSLKPNGDVLQVIMEDGQEFEVNKKAEITAVYRFGFKFV